MARVASTLGPFSVIPRTVTDLLWRISHARKMSQVLDCEDGALRMHLIELADYLLDLFLVDDYLSVVP